MKFSRRDLIKSAAVATSGVVAGAVFSETAVGRQVPAQAATHSLPPAFEALQPLGDRVKPIRTEELQARVAHAQQLMTDSKPRFEALYVTPGTTLVYYTGIRWWPSERIFAFMVPRQRDPLLVCPAFEEGRLREQLRWPVEIRVWQEDESPYPIIEKWLLERGIRTGQVGVESTTRYVFFGGLRHAATSLDYASGDPITVGCRAQKSAHELELMRLACSATCAVYKAIFASLHEGMTQREVSELAARG
jgi:Xaa-Pro dipeptidase